MQDILNTEYGGMNEVLYNLAAATNDDRWAKVGDRFTKKRFFNPLALRRDELRGLHVNTHIPQVIGAARRYEISGDMRFHDVADYFWYEVVERAHLCHRRHQQRRGLAGAAAPACGGVEAQHGHRGVLLRLQHAEADAPCSIAGRRDPRYFDLLRAHPAEPTYRNHSSRQSGTRNITFRSRPARGRRSIPKTIRSGAAPEPESKSIPSSTTAFTGTTRTALYVNLFIPSELNWAEKGFRLRQETNFPEQPDTTLIVTADDPVEMPIRIRIPGWADAGGVVKFNGKPLDTFAGPGSYLAIKRKWRTGDRVELACPCGCGWNQCRTMPASRRWCTGPWCWLPTWDLTGSSRK